MHNLLSLLYQSMKKSLSDDAGDLCKRYSEMYSSAFTLAEVLVTLGIIGVVSAMTVPTLMQNHQRKSYVTQLHKTYNIISQATLQYINDRNALNLKEAGISSLDAVDAWAKKYFKIVKDCGTDGSDCFAVGEYKKMDGTAMPIFTRKDARYYVLADGTAVAFIYQNNGIQVNLDINGKSGPNVVGRDTFPMMIYNDGTVDDSNAEQTPPPYTDEQRDETFNSYCNNGSDTSTWWGCTGKIIGDGWEMTY